MRKRFIYWYNCLLHFTFPRGVLKSASQLGAAFFMRSFGCAYFVMYV